MATGGHEVQGVLLQPAQPGRDLGGVARARRGQRHAMPRAAEQCHAHQLFERGDLPRNGALGERQLLGRAGETFVARRSLET